MVQLEYEAYKPMALLEMRRLRDCIRKTWDGIVRVLIVHRLGIVPVGEVRNYLLITRLYAAALSSTIVLRNAALYCTINTVM